MSPTGESRYNRFSYRERYGRRLQKLVLDAGFSCPNRDGTLGTEGCTFCDNAAFHPRYTGGRSITGQIDDGIAFNASRNPQGTGYLAYFQAFSNTYASLEVIRKRYEEALAHPLVEGLVIGTRPDCIDSGKLDYLESIKDRGKIVEVEFGVESVYDSTLSRVRRGHDFATACKAIKETAAHGLDVGVHMIIGLPGEDRAMSIAMIDKINRLPISSIKFHQLQILKGTRMEEEYKEHPEDFMRMDAERYIELLADMIERLRPDIGVARIASSVPPRFTDAPWGLLRHDALSMMLEKCLAGRDSRQACRYTQQL